MKNIYKIHIFLLSLIFVALTSCTMKTVGADFPDRSPAAGLMCRDLFKSVSNASEKSSTLQLIKDIESEKIQIRKLMKFGNPQIDTVVGPIEKLEKIILESNDPEIQKEALLSSIRYCREVSDNYTLGQSQKILPEYFDSIYVNTKLPDNLRKIAHDELNISQNKNEEFKTNEEINQARAAYKKTLDEETQNILASFQDAALETQRDFSGRAMNEIIKADSYFNLKIRKTAYNGRSSWRILEKPIELTSLKGREVLVRYFVKKLNQTIELRGEIIEEAQVGFKMKALNGKVLDIYEYSTPENKIIEVFIKKKWRFF